MLFDVPVIETERLTLRAARVEDFGAHAELAAVCKLRGGVVHDNRAIDFLLEAVRCSFVFSHDGICVSRRVGFDVSNALINAFNHFH